MSQELIDALKAQTKAIDSFVIAVAQLAAAVSQTLDPDDGDSQPATYMDGTPIQ